MGKIVTSGWGDFMVGDLFDIHPTKTVKDSKGKVLSNKDLFDGGKNPVIVNSAYNNGVGGYTSKNTTEKGGMITFSDTVDANTIFYQPNDFVGYSHVQGLYPIGKHKDKWTENSLKFFAVMFKAIAINKGFDFGNKFRRDIAAKLVVKLPVDATGTPDWKYMQDYIRSVEVSVSSSLSNLASANVKEKTKVNTSNFLRFKLYHESLFDIDSGTKLDKVKMTKKNPSINFVGRSTVNNGVTDFIDAIDDIKPYEAGLMTLSLGGEYLGSCFIQDKPFYTSQNVIVLKPKHKMSRYVKQYIATIIFRESQLHYKAFIDELNRHIKTDFSIPLPVDSNGNIDWDYMEQFMAYIEKRATNTLCGLL